VERCSSTAATCSLVNSSTPKAPTRCFLISLKAILLFSKRFFANSSAPGFTNSSSTPSLSNRFSKKVVALFKSCILDSNSDLTSTNAFPIFSTPFALSNLSTRSNCTLTGRLVKPMSSINFVRF